VSFLVYVARVYPALKPYIKGFYLTLNSWRRDRDDEGWKLITLSDDREEEDQMFRDTDAPEFVIPLSRLSEDVSVLETLTANDTPPRCFSRPTAVAVATYGFGDASGPGFGMSTWSAGDVHVDYRFGTWTPVITSRPSNYREFLNMVMEIEMKAERGELHKGTELFLFTDNFTTEAVFYSGNAKSRPLYELILRLHKVQMNGDIFVHIIWVSGKRMIAQGADGLSRGDLTNGVMSGKPMLDFAPLHLSAIQRREQQLKRLLDSCFQLPPGQTFCYLKPDEWYTLPFDSDGAFVWAPPPAAADAAVFQCAEAVHVRPWNTHIFLVPTLMTNRWRRTLSKASDFMMTLPFDKDAWPRESEFEPLTLAIVFPLLAREPWRVKRTDIGSERTRPVLGLQWGSFAHVRDYLRKLWVQARALEPMPGSLARSLLSGP